MPSANSCALIEIKHAEPAGMSRLGQNRTLWDVRFTPKSGHWLSVLGCPLCAKSRHRHMCPIMSALPAASAGRRSEDPHVVAAGDLARFVRRKPASQHGGDKIYPFRIVLDDAGKDLLVGADTNVIDAY